MASARIVFLLLFSATSLFARDLERVREVKARALAKLRVTAHASTTPKTINVDCTKGESIQEAVDKNAPPLDIMVEGLCVESVRIVGKDFILRGTDPNVDGIDGATVHALSAVNVLSATVENLQLINSPASGLSALGSLVSMTNCRLTGNATGITVINGTQFVGEGLTIASNARGIVANGALFAGCIGCTVHSNTGFAGVSTRGSILTFLDSDVSGPRGIQASAAYADFDCISENTPLTCSTQITGIAATAFLGGQAAMFATGDFTGTLVADDRADITLLGARQTASGTNQITNLATLQVHRSFDTGEESRIRGTNLDGFARALIRNASTIDGNIQCSAAADAWLDPAVIKTPGSTVTGCEHGS